MPQLSDFGIKKDAVISPCKNYRYCLYRIWDISLPLTLYIALNPSTADAGKDDNTIRRLIRFTRDAGCGGFYLLNLFAFRTTYPIELSKAIDPIGSQNDEWMFRILDMADFKRIVFCWGAYNKLNGRDKKIISMFPNAYCFGKTAAGHPKHPLFLSAQTPLIQF